MKDMKKLGPQAGTRRHKVQGVSDFFLLSSGGSFPPAYPPPPTPSYCEAKSDSCGSQDPGGSQRGEGRRRGAASHVCLELTDMRTTWPRPPGHPSSNCKHYSKLQVQFEIANTSRSCKHSSRILPEQKWNWRTHTNSSE
jgi:hypothetical protein